MKSLYTLLLALLPSFGVANILPNELPAECECMISLYETIRRKGSASTGQRRNWTLSMAADEGRNIYSIERDVLVRGHASSANNNFPVPGSRGRKWTEFTKLGAQGIYRAVAAVINGYKMETSEKARPDENLSVRFSINDENIEIYIAVYSRKSAPEEIRKLLVLSENYIYNYKTAKRRTRR